MLGIWLVKIYVIWKNMCLKRDDFNIIYLHLSSSSYYFHIKWVIRWKVILQSYFFTIATIENLCCNITWKYKWTVAANFKSGKTDTLSSIYESLSAGNWLNVCWIKWKVKFEVLTVMRMSVAYWLYFVTVCSNTVFWHHFLLNRNKINNSFQEKVAG